MKVCCYAIAAEEPEAFIDRWLESMKGADYICVLVTKEGDKNWYYFNKKKKDYPQLIVAQKTIKPWRFDVARNESMKLIPEDSDVLICTDIDEVLIEDFWDDLRKEVFEHPNFDRIYYRYAWSHDDNGDPKWVFWYDKITKPKGWYWDYPVHEALKCPNMAELGYNGEYRLDENKIYLHHYPDKTKSRGSYLGLLEMRAEKYPDDLYGLYYLAREYSFKADYEHALTTAVRLYTRLLRGDPTPEELSARDDMMMLPGVCVMLGDYFFRLGMKEDSAFYYKKAIQYDPTVRDGYIKLAQLYAYSDKPLDCYNVLDDMEKSTIYREDWRLVTYYWKPWKTLQIRADAKCWQEKYEEAVEMFEEASKSIITQDDKNDATIEGFYDDYKFALNKLQEVRNK